MTGPAYDKSVLFDTIKNLQETQIGDTLYFIDETNKIKEGAVTRIEITLLNEVIPPVINLNAFMYVYLHVQVGQSSANKRFRLFDLYKSKEAAADAFLKANDVPAELLKVIFPKKENKLKKLSVLDPSIKLGDKFSEIVNFVSGEIIAKVELNENYWDCDCNERYIHPNTHNKCVKCGVQRGDAPNSRKNEVCSANMAEEE